jgi:hypothetical protein
MANKRLFDGAQIEIGSLPIEAPAPPPVGGGQVKVWNGSAFIAKPAKVWDGASFITKPVKVWDGAMWATTNY